MSCFLQGLWGRPSDTVNFKENHTKLFQYINSGDWSACIKHAKKNTEEVKIWVQSSPNDGSEYWRMLPLHAAILAKAPAVVVEILLELYPDASEQKDDKGILPIHMALDNFNPDDNVIYALIEEYPMGLIEPNPNEGFTLSDYEINCPIIFNYIESKEWDHVITHVKKYPAIVRTWLIRREKIGNIRWRLLPLHAAIIFKAPPKTIRALLEEFPEGSKCLDDKGMTALHREVIKDTPDVLIIEMLTKAMVYPYSVTEYTEEEEDYLVDYDENCPVLYEYIENREWSLVLSRVITNPEEAQTWVMKKDGEDISYRHLPLHLALTLDPPTIAINALLTGYVDGILYRDHKGLLPLQIALDEEAPEEILKCLLKALQNPEQICLTDNLGVTLLSNYDINSPKLHKLIEAKDWEGSINHVKMFPEDAKTWTMRKQKNGKLRWRMLPIHAAIIFNAPLEVIVELLNAYVDGAQCRDDRGMMPIELAKVKNSRYDVIEALVDAFPQGQSP